MFTVKVKKTVENFRSWEAAKAFAEKESYLQNAVARIYSSKGVTVIKI